MYTGIKIEKFTLTESKPILKLTEEQKLEFVRKSRLKIELIEVEDIDNPSDLIVVITTEAFAKKVVPFYFYKNRTQFIHQNGKFILDTKEIADFLIEIGGTNIDIRIMTAAGVNKYKVTMYYRAYPANEEIK